MELTQEQADARCTPAWYIFQCSDGKQRGRWGITQNQARMAFVRDPLHLPKFKVGEVLSIHDTMQ